MQDNKTYLEKLCDYIGIITDYADIWGERHFVSDSTRYSLLAAMGIRVSSEEEAGQRLEELKDKEWLDRLPPVLVVWENQETVNVEITLPVHQAESDFERLYWRLLEENGSQRQGDLSSAGLTVLETRTIGGGEWQRFIFPLTGLPAPGYHRLEIFGGEEDWQAGTSLIVAPLRCYQPQALEGTGRVWGLAAQLYSLRSERNWGIGDYTDLIRLLEFAAQSGAGVVGLNPLHALFPHNPVQASPYSPSSRLFYNVLNLDIEAIADFNECQEARQRLEDESFQAKLRALRTSEFVDYSGVAEVKFEVLEILYRHFRRHYLEQSNDRSAAFRSFQSGQGKELRNQALYEALQEHFQRQDPEITCWQDWPEFYQDPESGAVTAFIAANVERLEFFEYLQWQAWLQLEAAGRRAWELGLGVGLYQDLAVSVDPGGAEVWANQDLYGLGASIGSPPDDFNLKGQDWGLPAWIPARLRESAYAPFISTLRQNMRYAGALRLDHVMGLKRLYWIPLGLGPDQGAYISYPFQEMLGILALESWRNRCLIIGEDLGTVPDEIRQSLGPLGILSYRLFLFEKDQQGMFKRPADYPSQALVAPSTHDLPTLAGFWAGEDLDARQALQLFPDQDIYEKQVVERAGDRARLLLALKREGLLPEGMAVNPVSVPEMTPALRRAVHLYLARTPAKIMVAGLEDILGQVEQVNLPGTVNEVPNWRRRLSLVLENWSSEEEVERFMACLRRERGAAVAPPRTPFPEEAGKYSGSGFGREFSIPRATYRLQFHSGFRFEDAASLTGYLRTLGISHCYSSPCLKARPGSSHGYDIIDHNSLNPELGGWQGFVDFSNSLKEQGLGHILDIVPNHMGIMGSDNIWWLDVLENGPSSNYARFFDIDWAPLKDELRGKVLLPVLGDHYGNVLDRGDLSLRFFPGQGSFSVEYYEHRFPIDPRQYPRILGRRLHDLSSRMGEENPALLEFQSLVTSFGNLPSRDKTTSEAVNERNRDKEVHKHRLAELYGTEADISHYLEECLREYNGGEDYQADPALLHELLEVQAWRLAYWRVAAEQINYRRFFDINDLGGLGMENQAVFEASHKLVLNLIGEDRVQGLRIDHPDGLFDPVQYFKRLQERVAALAGMATEQKGSSEPFGPLAYHNLPEGFRLRDSGFTLHPAPYTFKPSGDTIRRPLYIVAEKILVGDEVLPGNWPVHGTTGYDFAALCTGLFVDPAGAQRFTGIYEGFLGRSMDFREILARSKKQIMRGAMAAELKVLTTELARIAESDPHTRDFTLDNLEEALTEIVAFFPVYRTYISRHQVFSADQAIMDKAVTMARKRSRSADLTIYDFIRDVLLTTIAQGKSESYRQRVFRFAMRFQQYTGPVMAKGMEDTSFYRYNRLVSLNDVGGEPDCFGITVEEFHQKNISRQKNWPHSMLNTSTHDSKRSEDVRARISLISEFPEEWKAKLDYWSRLNKVHKRQVTGQLNSPLYQNLPSGKSKGKSIPDSNTEYLLYQTLIGAWPLEDLEGETLDNFRQRIQGYMTKAVKEAKVHTSWLNPDPDYEEALQDFIEVLLDPARSSVFQEDFLSFQQKISRLAFFNSLGQTMLKLTSPGVPDIYQGNEFWDYSLVDPDNRRPVDYEHRRRLLENLQGRFSSGEDSRSLVFDLLHNMEDGRIKLYLIWKVLNFRREFPELFEQGKYLPLKVTGSRADHICSFARCLNGKMMVVSVPRLVGTLLEKGSELPLQEEVWTDTVIWIPENPECGQALLEKENFSELMTGGIVSCRQEQGRLWLPAKEVFADFPGSLLHI
ncbi:MAG: malto-oligosyltrehalose synthase [Desulfobia sp.]